MVLTSTVTVGLFGTDWLVCSVCGIYPCIGGDFNVVRFPCGRLGVPLFSPMMTEFSDFISEQGLMGLPLAGGLFKWSKYSSWSRLNRFLVSPDWEARYPGLF